MFWQGALGEKAKWPSYNTDAEQHQLFLSDDLGL